MVSRNLIKSEIDKVRNEYLDLLYAIVKLFENRAGDGESQALAAGHQSDWQAFVTDTYGCLADAPITRPEQGHFESRETIE